MQVGDIVRRKTNEAGYQGTGEVIEINGDRARVKWLTGKRTWYKIANLEIVAPAAASGSDAFKARALAVGEARSMDEAAADVPTDALTDAEKSAPWKFKGNWIASEAPDSHRCNDHPNDKTPHMIPSNAAIGLTTAAARLNGRSYPFQLSAEEVELFKNSGLVVVHGAGDDLLEVDGAIRDETGCYDGGDRLLSWDGFVSVDRNGLFDDPPGAIDEARRLVARYDAGKWITAVWSGDAGYVWHISIDDSIPHATFDILDGDEKFCRAIVFNVIYVS